MVYPNGQISVANESAAQILGYSRERLIGKGWAELFLATEGNDDFNQVFVDVIQEERLNLHRTVSYRQISGRKRHLSMTTSFLKQDGRLEGIVLLMDDVTELHRMQELEKAILSENHRIQRERAESLQKLAMAVAHQLRNPLTAIGGLALLLLRRSQDPATVEKVVNDILADTRRLEAIVKSVEEYTRIPRGQPTAVEVSQLLTDLQEYGNAIARHLSRDIQWVYHVEEMNITVDSQSFVLALREVVKNSVEFLGRSKGSILINAYREEGRTAVFEVIDDGIGISEQDCPFIFDPFFTTKAAGVGMGLCRVERILSDHKGTVSVDSRVGRGTAVQLRIPLRGSAEKNELTDERLSPEH